MFLIAQGGPEGKGILIALGAFLGVFWCSLWKIMCLRCCCHRRRICAQKKAQARLEQQTKRRKRRGSDPDEFETDFHHVNTQVRTFATMNSSRLMTSGARAMDQARFRPVVIITLRYGSPLLTWPAVRQLADGGAPVSTEMPFVTHRPLTLIGHCLPWRLFYYLSPRRNALM